MKLKLSMAKYQQNKLKTLFLRKDEYLSSEKKGEKNQNSVRKVILQLYDIRRT